MLTCPMSTYTKWMNLVSTLINSHNVDENANFEKVDAMWIFRWLLALNVALLPGTHDGPINTFLYF